MSSCSATASTGSAASRAALIDLAYAKGLPLVATNEPYFASTDDYEAHDALLCIAGGRLIAETDRDQLTPDHRFKTRAEMAVLFADIAGGARLHGRDRRALRVPADDAQAHPAALHRRRRRQCAGSREAANCAGRRRRDSPTACGCTACRRARREEDYRERLAFELDVITRMNYAGYFLIVADFIK